MSFIGINTLAKAFEGDNGNHGDQQSNSGMEIVMMGCDSAE